MNLLIVLKVGREREKGREREGGRGSDRFTEKTSILALFYTFVESFIYQ